MNENTLFELDGLEPELELRLTALVMGEASDLERDQLEMLLQERADAAAWYRQLRQLHAGLAELAAIDAEAVAEDFAEDAVVGGASFNGTGFEEINNDWKLSADRRQQVLAVLDGQSPNPLRAEDGTKASVAKDSLAQSPAVKASTENNTVQLVPKPLSLRRPYWRRRGWLAVVAACLLLGVGLWSLRLSSSTSKVASARVLYERNVAESALSRSLESEPSAPPAAYGGYGGGMGIGGGMGGMGGGMGMGGMGMGGMGGRAAQAGRGLERQAVDSLVRNGAAVVGGQNRLGDELLSYPLAPNGSRGTGLYSGQSAGQPAAQSSDIPFRVWGFNALPELRGGSGLTFNLPADAPTTGGYSPESAMAADGEGYLAKDESRLDELRLDESLLSEQDALESLAEKDSVPDGGTILLGGIKRTRNESTVEKKTDTEVGLLARAGRFQSAVRDSQLSLDGLNETAAAGERFSTFSLHVSDVSFKLTMAALGRGEWPDPAKIRIEEFVNAMDYRDPLATPEEQVACQLEQAIHPHLMQRNLLRISLRTAATGRSQQQPLRLTLLLDNSGSMERPDRRQTVRRAFEALAQQLTPNDQVTLIGFANTPRLLAERVSGDKLPELVQRVEDLPSEGGTNLEAALRLAKEKSVEQARLAGSASAGLNRIVLMTDGAVNLGDADPQRLSELVTQMREAGIAFDAVGISALELNDEVLEALARQGDGRYYLLDASEDAGAGFADQIAGALRPAAKNVKVQVEFNPQRVGQYKLLGFEKHLLNPEDFRNDQVDAAELAAAEAGVAVYHFEPNPDGRGDVGSVSVRYQDLSSGLMVERRWPIPYQPQTPRLEQADPRIRIASVAALFAAKLRGDAVAYGTDLNELAAILSGLPSSYSNSLRVEQLRNMIEAARQLQP